MPPEGSNPRISGNTAQEGAVTDPAEDDIALKDFSDLASRELQRDPAFRAALLCEAVDTLLEGDHETAKLLLRDYVKATIGFEELGRRTGKSPKSLMRMLSVQGNPQAANLVAILRTLQEHEGIRLKIEAVDAA